MHQHERLKLVFPKQYGISQDKRIAVADLMKISNGILQWDMHFIRPVQHWELESSSNFLEMIYSIPRTGAGYDKMVWKVDKSKGFTMSRYYHALISPGDMSFTWKSIWTVKILLTVAFFSWTAAQGKILTIGTLCKREHWGFGLV